MKKENSDVNSNALVQESSPSSNINTISPVNPTIKRKSHKKQKAPSPPMFVKTENKMESTPLPNDKNYSKTKSFDAEINDKNIANKQRPTIKKKTKKYRAPLPPLFQPKEEEIDLSDEKDNADATTKNSKERNKLNDVNDIEKKAKDVNQSLSLKNSSSITDSKTVTNANNTLKRKSRKKHKAPPPPVHGNSISTSSANINNYQPLKTRRSHKKRRAPSPPTELSNVQNRDHNLQPQISENGFQSSIGIGEEITHVESLRGAPAPQLASSSIEQHVSKFLNFIFLDFFFFYNRES